MRKVCYTVKAEQAQKHPGTITMTSQPVAEHDCKKQCGRDDTRPNVDSVNLRTRLNNQHTAKPKPQQGREVLARGPQRRCQARDFECTFSAAERVVCRESVMIPRPVRRRWPKMSKGWQMKATPSMAPSTPLTAGFLSQHERRGGDDRHRH